MRSALVFVHLCSVAVWIGGMFFAQFCLRPAAFELLEPPQRLALMAGALARFFRWVGLAILLLWLTGLARMVNVGFAASPPAWHAMLTIALVMTVVFAVVAHVVFPKVRSALAAHRYAEAAAGLARVRGLVTINLGLGLLTIAVATLGR
jgi:uncharacterized membrane protein